MFIGPPVASGPELLIRHSDFVIRLTPGGLKFETVATLEGVQRTLEQWAELIRAISLMATRQATMTISGNSRIPAISLPADQPMSGPYLEKLPLISDFLDGWQRLLASAGVRSTTSIEFGAFWEADDARLAVDILLNPKPLARIEFQDLGVDEPPNAVEGLYFNNCSFADVNLTYSAKVFFERTNDPTWRYRSSRFQALDVRPKVEDHEEYGVDQAAANGLTLVINPNNMTLTREHLSDEVP